MKRQRFLLAALFSIVLFISLEAAPQVVGNVTRVTQAAPNRVILDTSSRAKVSVEFFDVNVVRVRVAPTGVFERDFSYAIDYSVDRHTPKVALTQDAKQVTLANYNGARVVINKTPFRIRIFDENKELVTGDDPACSTTFDNATGEIKTAKLLRGPVETFYGFGEKAFSEMQRNSKFIVNWNTDTFSYPIGTDPIYQSIPFFYALHDGKAYGLFFNNTYRTWFDVAKSSPDRISFGADGGELDYYVFTGGKERSPKQVLADYSNLTGKTPLPPVWALGNQQSRWSYFPEKRVREVAEGFRKNRIPLDVIYLDIDYMDQYRVFTWDKTRFPDPKKMIGDLKADGIRTVLIIDPGIKADNYDVHSAGKAGGVLVKNPDGSDLIRNVWPQESVFPDFTDAKAREWFSSYYRRHLDEGIAGFWTDMNEPGVFLTAKTEKPELLHHPAKTFPLDTPHKGDGTPGTHKRYHNVFGMQMARATFEGVKKLEPSRRPFVLTRAGFAGVQRYSAVWTGDNYASWDHLAMTIPMLTNMSVSGVPFVGADVGGFAEMPSGELYARWLQAAALTPFFRSHSVGWVGNKEPYAFGEEFTRINRSTIELRYQFLPYLYTLFYEHERTGQPIMRPLWYEFPNDRGTYLINDQYMVGSDVMVAPVVRQGMDTRGIYLPLGAEWVDWWTGEKYESGKTHYLKAPIDRLPIFARAGAVIPTQAVIQHTGEMPASPITLNVVAGATPGKNVTASLFQDAGEGYGYRLSDRRIIKFAHRPGTVTIDRVGDFQGQQIRYVEAIGISADPKEIRGDSRRLDHIYDPSRKRVRAELRGDEKELTLIR